MYTNKVILSLNELNRVNPYNSNNYSYVNYGLCTFVCLTWELRFVSFLEALVLF